MKSTGKRKATVRTGEGLALFLSDILHPIKELSRKKNLEYFKDKRKGFPRAD